MAEHAPAAIAAPEVIAFSQDAETQDFLDVYLTEAAGGPIRSERGGVDQAIACLETAARPPRLLIVDLSGSDKALSDMDRLAEACEPSIVVLAVGENNAVQLFRGLVRAGVADYITKPLIPELLDPYVRERRASISELGQAVRRGKVVCFAGARGGVGATTLAVGCAWRLSHAQQRRVALLDLDVHSGSVCVQLGLQPGGLLEALEEHDTVDSLYTEQIALKAAPRLSVFADEASFTAPVHIDPKAMDSLISVLSDEYHYVLIDLPGVLSPLHAHVLAAARARIIVADRTLPGMRDAGRLIEQAATSLAPSLLVVNDHHPGLAGQMDDEMIEEAVSRSPDIEIGYDRRAAQRIDNLGEAASEIGGPVSAGVRDIVGWLSGKRSSSRRKGRFSLFGGGG